eukprot:g10132.t1
MSSLTSSAKLSSRCAKLSRLGKRTHQFPALPFFCFQQKLFPREIRLTCAGIAKRLRKGEDAFYVPDLKALLRKCASILPRSDAEKVDELEVDLATIVFSYLATVGPCRELFGNLVFDFVETLQVLSVQGTQSFLQLPRLAYTEYKKFEPLSCPDCSHDDPQEYWNQTGRACDVRTGGSVSFAQIFDATHLDRFLQTRFGMGGVVVRAGQGLAHDYEHFDSVLMTADLPLANSMEAQYACSDFVDVAVVQGMGTALRENGFLGSGLIFVMTNEPVRSAAMSELASVLQSRYGLTAVRVSVSTEEDQVRLVRYEDGRVVEVGTKTIPILGGSGSGTVSVRRGVPEEEQQHLGVHPLELLALEMYVATARSAVFLGYGDGIVNGYCSAPSLIVHQMRLHTYGQTAAKWVFEEIEIEGMA